MSQITIGGTTLNFKDSSFTGDQWEQVASWVLNGGAEGIDANAQIATEKAAAASASAAAARNSATSAGESATAAAESIKHAPRINAEGKWELWDAATNAYVATEYTAIGEDGTKWWTYAYPIGITDALEIIMSKSNLPDAAIGDYVLHTMGNAGIVFEITGETADGSSWVVKEKCTLRGKDGTTPHIGANGNWYIGDTDTGKPSRGATGANGEKGDPGKDGANGITPTIGANGNWYIGETDTGVKAAAAEAATHETAGIVKPSADFDITEDGTLSLYKAMEILSIKMNDIKPTGSYPLYILYEKGTKLTGFVVAWELNKVPMRQTFLANVSGGVGLDEMDIGTKARSTSDLSGEQLGKWEAFANKEYTILSAFATLQFVLKATDARGKSDTQLLRIHAYNGVYTGAASSPGVIDATFLNTLKKSVAGGYAKTFTVDANAGQYIWYACPTKLHWLIESDVTPTFNVGGFDGGFSKVATFDFTNTVGYTEEYQVWRSDNAGLGSTTVKVS